MYKLLKKDYLKIKPFIQSSNELSVFSVIDGVIPGDIFVNNPNEPSAALIKTSECNLVAGEIDEEFISAASSELDFWDHITPDSDEWFEKIPVLHKNKYIRPFKRRQYLLSPNHFTERSSSLTDGFVMEKVNLDVLRTSSYKNAGKVLDWAQNWGSDAAFYEKGVGNYIRNSEAIVSWSLSDCSYGQQIAIGVNTDDRFRKQGFGIKVVSKTVKDCFKKNYDTIHWLCVDTNRGSISIAEKLGFIYSNAYYFFCSYLPTENLPDISEKEWAAWGEYLEEASIHEPKLINETLYSYIKANNVLKSIDIMKRMPQYGRTPNMSEYGTAIHYFQSIGLCSNFNRPEWLEFVSSHNLTECQ